MEQAVTPAELADAVERADGPSYVLDCEIWDAVYPGERDQRFEKVNRSYGGRLGPADKDGYVKPLRAFTASLDAAMTLVPEGWSLSLGEKRVLKCWDAWLHDHNTADGIAVSHADARAASPALALVAAALRARGREG